MGERGECPSCGRVLTASVAGEGAGQSNGPRAHGAGAPGDAAGTEIGDTDDLGEEDGPAPATPWHFKLLMVALVIYLGYRLFQGIVWVAGHL